jgi:hypothetical protein
MTRQRVAGRHESAYIRQTGAVQDAQ